MAKTEILEYNVNWNSIKRACMRTIGKDAGDKEPPETWKKKILICRHSPNKKRVDHLEMVRYSIRN